MLVYQRMLGDIFATSRIISHCTPCKARASLSTCLLLINLTQSSNYLRPSGLSFKILSNRSNNELVLPPFNTFQDTINSCDTPYILQSVFIVILYLLLYSRF